MRRRLHGLLGLARRGAGTRRDDLTRARVDALAARPIRRIGDVALGLIGLSALGTIVVLGLRFFAELS